MAAHAKEIGPASLSGFAPERPLISNEKLRLLYTEMLRLRRIINVPNRQSRNTRSFPEAAIVACTIDLRADDTLLSHDRALPRIAHAQHHSPAESRAANHALIGLATGAAVVHRAQEKENLVVVFVSAAEVARNPDFLRTAQSESLPVIYIQTGRAMPKKPQHGRLPTLPPSIPVDQADAVAVYRVASEAIDKARRGAGPTLIQCLPYKVKKHAATKPAADPLLHMESYLRKKNLWSDELKIRLVSP